MKRLLRRTISLSAAALAGLCVAVCALWVISLNDPRYAWLRASPWGVSAVSDAGIVELKAVRYQKPDQLGLQAFAVHWARRSDADPQTQRELIRLGQADDPLLRELYKDSGEPLNVLADGSYEGISVPGEMGIHSYDPPDYRCWHLAVRHWLAALALAAAPALWLAARRARRRAPRPAVCRARGFDLRATPDGAPSAAPTSRNT